MSRRAGGDSRSAGQLMIKLLRTAKVSPGQTEYSWPSYQCPIWQDCSSSAFYLSSQGLLWSRSKQEKLQAQKSNVDGSKWGCGRFIGFWGLSKLCLNTCPVNNAGQAWGRGQQAEGRRLLSGCDLEPSLADVCHGFGSRIPPGTDHRAGLLFAAVSLGSALWVWVGTAQVSHGSKPQTHRGVL